MHYVLTYPVAFKYLLGTTQQTTLHEKMAASVYFALGSLSRKLHSPRFSVSHTVCGNLIKHKTVKENAQCEHNIKGKVKSIKTVF